MSRVVLGTVAGAFGVRGWVKVRSYTRPSDGILKYRAWNLDGREYELMDGRSQGTAIVAQLDGVGDRDAALALGGKNVEVDRSQLPPAGEGEFYWADLVGCAARSESGDMLGKVVSLFSNGAQDVLVVSGERERLIPFVAGAIVKSVDLRSKVIVVDWDADF